MALLLVCLSGFADAASPASVAPDIPLAPEPASENFLVKQTKASGQIPRSVPGRAWQKSVPGYDRVIGRPYCHNDPVNKFDVLGLYDEEADKALTAINEQVAALDAVIASHKRAQLRLWIGLNEGLAAGTEFMGGPLEIRHSNMQGELTALLDQRDGLSERRGELIQQRGQTRGEKLGWGSLAVAKGLINLTPAPALMARNFEETPVMGIVNLTNMASGLEDTQPFADGIAEVWKTTDGKVTLAGAPLLILRGKLPKYRSNGGGLLSDANSAVRQRVLANIAESQQARASSGFAQTSRRWTATDFYEGAGWPSRRIQSHLDGIDFGKPVSVSNLPAGSRVVQYQIPDAPVGNYFAPIGTPGSQIGIYTGGRVPQVFQTTGNVRVLQSTAGSVVDDWSVPFWRVQTDGGGTQFFAPNPSLFRLVE